MKQFAGGLWKVGELQSNSFALNFQLEKKAKSTFTLHCKQLLSGCDFLIASSRSCSLPEIYATIKKNLAKPAVVLAIFKANGIGIDRNTTK